MSPKVLYLLIVDGRVKRAERDFNSLQKWAEARYETYQIMSSEEVLGQGKS